MTKKKYVFVVSGSRFLEPPQDSKSPFYEEYTLRFNEALLVLHQSLDLHLKQHGVPVRFYDGDARGVDRRTRLWMYGNLHPQDCIAVPAPWKELGKSAGSVRNRQMLDAALEYATLRGVGVHVVGFPEPASRGTLDMLAYAHDKQKVEPALEVFVYGLPELIDIHVKGNK